MKLLIGSPRCGSTNISMYFNEYNKKHINCKVHDGFAEYLLDAPHSDQVPLDVKVQYIEDCRKNGYELLYKIHAFHLFQNDWLYEWFLDFYKEAEIYVLKRKNLWKAYTSLLAHNAIGRKLWHNDGTKQNELQELLRSIDITHDTNVIKNFLQQQQHLNSITGIELFMEDLNHEKMNLMLGLNITEEFYKPWNIEYEQYIH